MLRRALAVVAGIVAGSIIVGGVELLGHKLFPPPAGIDLSNPAEMAGLMKDMPVAALAMVVVAWALGALGGGWIAAKIARDLRPALIVGFFLTLAGVLNMNSIPHPIWMWVCGLLVPLPLAWLGARSAGVPVRAAPGSQAA